MITKIPIRPNLSNVETELYVGKGVLRSQDLRDFCNRIGGKRVIIADSAIADGLGRSLQVELKAELIPILGGESAKTQSALDAIIKTLFSMGCDKDTLLIGMGGGAVTDVVGFAASTFLRGVSFLLIPTTLLAMVDASIGGKTAINTPFGKNLLGSLYHPKAIFIDLEILDTLPEKEKWNGEAEVIKIGLVWDPSIWDLAMQGFPGDAWIRKAIAGKIAVIQNDPTERGLRRILNFGHTIGHGLEALSHFQMPHGIAVAIGSLAEAHLSMSLGYLSPAAFSTIPPVYERFSLKLPKDYTREHLHRAMTLDKKGLHGQPRFVLIDQIGHAISFDGAFCRFVSEKELDPTLDWMEREYG